MQSAEELEAKLYCDCYKSGSWDGETALSLIRARDRERVKVLKPYIRHLSDCAKWGGLSVINPVKCTCGLDSVLRDLD